MHIVLTNDAKTIAGGENYVLFLAGGLRERGHRVTIAPLESSELAEAARAAGYQTVPLPYASGGREIGLGFRLAKLLRPLQPDVIHSNSNYDRTIGAIAGRRMGAATIASIHSCMSIRRNVTHAFRNRYLIDHFTPVGYSTKKILVEKDGIDERRISVVHIGIPESKTVYSQEGRASVRAEFGIAENAFVIGTLSRLVEFKGHAWLVKAAPAIIQAVPGVRFLIVGDGELRAALEREAEECGARDAFTFAGRRSDIANTLSAFDVIAQPSIDFGGETFPVSLIEANAVGIPIVASEVGDVAYLVRNGESGFLIPPAQPELLAERLIRIAQRPGLRSTMADKAREHFLAKLTLPVMVSAMEEVYKKVLEKRRS